MPRPRRVLPFGALKHRERPATHNVGLVGVSCCGELRLSVEPNPFRHTEGGELVVTTCLGCGRPIDVRRVLDEEPSDWVDREDDVDEGSAWGV